MNDKAKSNQPVAEDVLRALVGYLQSNSNAADLQPIQKQVPLQFLAIRNGHGDYGLSGGLSAFMASPILEVTGSGETATGTLEFVGKLPSTTAKVYLRGKLTESRSFCIANPQDPADIELESYGDDVLLVQAVDAHEVLVAIGVPTVKRVPASEPTYAS